MKQYSVDLRERLLGAIDAGLSQAEAARLFGVGTSTITRWRQRRAETQTLRPTPRPGRAPRIGPAQADALQAQVAAHNDATLAEHCATWAREHNVPVSVATMSRAIRRLGITVKKSPVRRRTG
jgi:transposase